MSVFARLLSGHPRASTRGYISPLFGYSILRQNRLGAAGGATGLAKVSATASHSSGPSPPRRRTSPLPPSHGRGEGVVAIRRPAGVDLQRIGIRDLHAGGVLEPLPRFQPQLGAAVERPAVRPALLVERRRIERGGAEIHRLHDGRIGLAQVLELV